MRFTKSALLAVSLATASLGGCATTAQDDQYEFRVLPMEDFASLNTTLKTRVTFAQDQRNLTEPSRREINALLPMLRNDASMDVLVAGHASQEGDAQYNLDLSVQRGVSVAQYLVANGIARNRIVVMGFGESRPDTTVEGGRSNTANRRAEIYVY